MLAELYLPPAESGYEPTVTVVVPCRNEAGMIADTLAHVLDSDYPPHKLQLIVVDDASCDGSYDAMCRVQANRASLVVVRFWRHRGKRYGMAVGALLSTAEILVFVDSDTLVRPNAIRMLVQGFADASVGGVSGYTDVQNADANVLTKMQHVRYFLSYQVIKAAESVFGAVSCCPGCFSAYRRACVLEILDRWLNQRFLGRVASHGDDRSLTNEILKTRRVLYDARAWSTTVVPTRWSTYIRQQCRWKRSWIRELFFAAGWFWRKPAAAAIAWYLMAAIPFLSPLIVLKLLLVDVVAGEQASAIYALAMALLVSLWGLYYFLKTKQRDWYGAFVLVATYMLFFCWQFYYAAATLRNMEWGTRE